MSEAAADELRRRISEYPPGARPFFQNAFSIATGLANDHLDAVLSELIGNFRRGKRNIDGSSIAALANISPRDSDQIASVFSLIVGLLSESRADAEDFVAGARGVLFKDEDEAVALTIAKVICDRREDLSRSIERARLGGSILPSWSTINLAVDIRVQFEGGKVKTTAPLAVVHIDTDVPETQLWLQMSEADIEDAIAKLNKCLEELRIANTLVSLGS